MTLVLTEISQTGIVLGADTTISLKIGDDPASYYKGFQKIIPVYRIHSGIGIYGNNLIMNSSERADQWIKKIVACENYTKISELKDIIESLFKEDKDGKMKDGDMLGFQLTGYEEEERDGVLTKKAKHFHIYNYNIKDLKLKTDYIKTDRVVYEEDGIWYGFNGEVFWFYKIFKELYNRFDEIRSYGFEFPDMQKFGMTPLRIRAEFVRFWINFMARIYSLSNQDPVIGEEVTTLSISKNYGIEDILTK